MNPTISIIRIKVPMTFKCYGFGGSRLTVIRLNITRYTYIFLVNTPPILARVTSKLTDCPQTGGPSHIH